MRVCYSPSLQDMPPSLAVSLRSSHPEETSCTAAMQPLGQGQQRCMCTLTSVLHDRRSSPCICVCSLVCCMTQQPVWGMYVCIVFIVSRGPRPHRRGCSFIIHWTYHAMMLLSCVSVVTAAGISPICRLQVWPGRTTCGSVWCTRGVVRCGNA